MLDFQRIHFFKRVLNVPPLLLNQIVKINLFELDHQILSQCPIRRFLTVITNFLGALSQKEDDF